MKLGDRIKVLVKLGEQINAVLKGSNEVQELTSLQGKLMTLIESVHMYNAWFSPENVRMALRGLTKLLGEEELIEFTSKYIKDIEDAEAGKPVGIVMAGNLPLVGMHDFICVFLAGQKSLVKLSSDDDKLFPLLRDMMVEINQDVKELLVIQEEKLSGFDKVIATGSDNTARHFEYYFRNVPSIIRKSRTSVAVLGEGTSEADIKDLATDLFSYFGMGCRSVSKLMIHKSVDVKEVIRILIEQTGNLDNVKYQNNLDYNKSIYLINSVPFLDGGLFLMKQSEDLFSPISVVYFDHFENDLELEQYLQANVEQIQCVVGNRSNDEIQLGNAQFPGLSDYADGVDIMDFVLK